MQQDMARRLDQMEARLIGRIEDMKRDITSRQDKTNGNVGRALDKTAALEAIAAALRHELDRTRDRVHDLATSVMEWLNELGLHRAAAKVQQSLAPSPSGDDRYWRWRDTRWLLYIVGGAIGLTILVLRAIGWGPP